MPEDFKLMLKCVLSQIRKKILYTSYNCLYMISNCLKCTDMREFVRILRLNVAKFGFVKNIIKM